MQTLRNAASDQRQQTTDRRGCRVRQGRNAQNKNKRGGRNAKDAGGTSYHISCHKEVVEIRRIQLNVQCPESPSADQSTGTHKGTQLISYQCWPVYTQLISHQCWPVYTQPNSYSTQRYTIHQLLVLLFKILVHFKHWQHLFFHFFVFTVMIFDLLKIRPS